MHTFIAVGCVQCHSGPNLDGMSYRKTGIFHDYSNRKDLGRFKVTKLESDKYVFKVPMLRNVTLTGPYFHDGEVGTLAEAVDQMAYLFAVEQETQGRGNQKYPQFFNYAGR